LEIAVNDVKNK
jgi:hypothetical protein